MAAVQTWMTYNNLKLNPDKTEFLLIGTASKRAELAHFFPIDLLGSLVSPSDKNLGVTFDFNFTFSDYVSAVCRECFIKITKNSYPHSQV